MAAWECSSIAIGAYRPLPWCDVDVAFGARRTSTLLPRTRVSYTGWGVVAGPRMLVSVHALGSRGGHCDNTGFPYPRFGPEPGLAEGIAIYGIIIAVMILGYIK